MRRSKIEFVDCPPPLAEETLICRNGLRCEGPDVRLAIELRRHSASDATGPAPVRDRSVRSAAMPRTDKNEGVVSEPADGLMHGVRLRPVISCNPGSTGNGPASAR